MDKRNGNKKVIRVAMYCRMGRDNDADRSPQGRGNSLPDAGERGRAPRRKK